MKSAHASEVQNLVALQKERSRMIHRMLRAIGAEREAAAVGDGDSLHGEG